MNCGCDKKDRKLYPAKQLELIERFPFPSNPSHCVSYDLLDGLDRLRNLSQQGKTRTIWHKKEQIVIDKCQSSDTHQLNEFLKLFLAFMDCKKKKQQILAQNQGFPFLRLITLCVFNIVLFI